MDWKYSVYTNHSAVTHITALGDGSGPALELPEEKTPVPSCVTPLRDGRKAINQLLGNLQLTTPEIPPERLSIRRTIPLGNRQLAIRGLRGRSGRLTLATANYTLRSLWHLPN